MNEKGKRISKLEDDYYNNAEIVKRLGMELESSQKSIQ